MVEVTRLNGKKFYLNPHQIEFLEETPDTIVTLLSGKKLVLADHIPDLIKRIIEYRHNIGITFSEFNE